MDICVCLEVFLCLAITTFVHHPEEIQVSLVLIRDDSKEMLEGNWAFAPAGVTLVHMRVL
jgi:hypothetical protein